ncbi:MAG: FAD-binding protein [Balneolaceae bacterium]|nr:MAG: FAD-binding protein [Balneolaceae bacterium]
MIKSENDYEVIIAGAGMGGLSAACFLANDGYSVLLLEKAHAAGGCSSSYFRKGYIFESGATTLIGFDDNQPLRLLESKLGIIIPKEKIEPSMTVYMDGKKIIRWQDRKKWIREIIKHFGEPAEQEMFWKLSYQVSDVVWKVSAKNNFFPPIEKRDWLKLLWNNPMDVWVLPYAFRSVRETAISMGISNPDFFRFLDEQLMISSQAPSSDTPFLFGAPAMTYTNYTNYYVPGGLIEMVNTLTHFINEKGGQVKTKEGVLSIDKDGAKYKVMTQKGREYSASAVISNLPVWNMGRLTSGDISEYFYRESSKYDKAWGAFTMGVVTDDVYPGDMSLHHQLHFENDAAGVDGLDSGSVFVSFSDNNDRIRAKAGDRVLNVSAHALPDYWFGLNGKYEAVKNRTQDAIIELLRHKLPGFSNATIKMVFSSTPVTWNNWVYRKKGRVGGIPQSMSRSLLNWTPNQTPFPGLFLCGDTVFPGQGIPGVTLSGFNVYLRAVKHLRNFSNH